MEENGCIAFLLKIIDFYFFFKNYHLNYVNNVIDYSFMSDNSALSQKWM